MEVRDDLKLIFFLTYSDKPPRAYYDLAIHFKDEGLTLVPIKFDQLLSFYQGKKRVHVINVVSNTTERKLYFKTLNIIRQALLNNKITLYHFSSYSHLDIRNEIPRIKNYHFIRLPVRLYALARAIHKFYRHSMRDEQKWPGGRRATLPFDEVVYEE